MADNMDIRIRAGLDHHLSKTKINNDIEKLKGQIKHLRINLSVDKNQIEKLNKSIKTIHDQASKPLNLGVETKKLESSFDKLTVKTEAIAGSAKKITQEIRESTTQSGHIKKVIDDIDKNTGKVYKTTEITTANYKKQREEAEKLANAMASGREKSQLKEKQKALKDIENQSKAINKTLEDEYKQRLKLADAIAKGREAAQSNTLKRDRELELKQNQAINRAMDERYKQQIKLNNQLDLFKQKMVGSGDFTGQLDIFAAKNPKYVAAIAKLKAEINSLGASTPNVQKRMKELEIQFSSLKQQTIQAGTVLGRTIESFVKFIRFYLVGGMVVRALGSIRKTIEDISEINKSMIMLERVSNASTPQIESFMMKSPQMASNLGVLNQEVQYTTAEIVKLGYSLKDAEQLMELSILMKTVGNIENVASATDYLVSIIKGFKVEVEDASQIVDFLNHVANTSSIDMTNIGEGLLRMSSAMSEANNSLQESVGLLVSGYDITRNAEKTSTALRTISINNIVAICSNAYRKPLEPVNAGCDSIYYC